MTAGLGVLLILVVIWSLVASASLRRQARDPEAWVRSHAWIPLAIATVALVLVASALDWWFLR